MTEITPSTSSIAKATTSIRAPGHAVSGGFASALALLLPGQGEVDAIDAHYLYPDGVAAVWLGRRLGLPVVLTARGTDVSLIPRHAGSSRGRSGTRRR